MDTTKTEKGKGLPSYENWKAALKGERSYGAAEYPLFTDAHITGEITNGCGPYQLLNAGSSLKPGVLNPSIVLRVEYHLLDDPAQTGFPPTDKTNITFYHGAWLNEEIAALISLCLGIRLKAGGQTRRFEPGRDLRGHPEGFFEYENPMFIESVLGKSILPRVKGTHCLDDLGLFSTFPNLPSEGAIALVQAARLYQDAVWVAESEPELSWVMLVSAIETAAGRWRPFKEPPIERLRASRPELVAKLVEVGGEEHASYVADQISDSIGATKKFIDFVLEYLPDPPLQRPSAGFQLSWDKSDLKKSLSVVYKWRSQALHSGVPFPQSMCWPPHSEGGAFSEIPIGLGCFVPGAFWVAEDTPMMLHVFEYIVRGALLKWWESMLPVAQVEPVS